MEESLTPLMAIKTYCFDCSGNSWKEVRECHMEKCPLWKYRQGKSGKKRNLTPAQRKLISERLHKG